VFNRTVFYNISVISWRLIHSFCGWNLEQFPAKIITWDFNTNKMVTIKLNPDVTLGTECCYIATTSRYFNIFNLGVWWYLHNAQNVVCRKSSYPRFGFVLTPLVVNLVSAHAEVNSIKSIVINFVSNLWREGDFNPVSSSNKYNRHKKNMFIYLNTIKK
jgi:hypothetical protein